MKTITSKIFLGIFILSSVSSIQLANSSTLGLLNFRQIFSAYDQIFSGITNEVSVKQIKKSVIGRLPIQGQVEEFSSPMIVGLVELSGELCRITVEKEKSIDASSRRFFQNIRFDKGLASLNETSLRLTYENLGLLFWSRVPTEMEVDQFSALVKEHMVVPGTLLSVVLQSLCVQYATSLPFLFEN